VSVGTLDQPRAVSRHATQDAQSNQARFGTEKTASVHDHHVLAELGVGGRGEAAPIVHRLDLSPATTRRRRAGATGHRLPVQGRRAELHHPESMEPYPPGGRPPERYVNGHPHGTEAASAETSDRDRKTCQPSTPRTAVIPAVALPCGRAASHRPEGPQTPSCLLRAARSAVSPLPAHLRPTGHVVASVLISLRCRTEWWEELSVQRARRAADASEKDRAVPGARTAGRRTASIWHVVEGQSLAVPGIRPGWTWARRPPSCRSRVCVRQREEPHEEECVKTAEI
jgi:hypothetical protein